MKTRLSIIVMTITIAGCATTDTTYGRPKVITPQTFACSDGQYAKVKVYSPAEAVMGYGGKQYEMKRVQTASGAKYAGQGAEFWSKGISAMITKDGKTSTCNFVPSDATGEEDLTLPGDAMAPYPAASVEKVSMDPEAADDEALAAPAPTPAAKPAAMAPLTATTAPAAPSSMPQPKIKPRSITTAN